MSEEETLCETRDQNDINKIFAHLIVPVVVVPGIISLLYAGTFLFFSQKLETLGVPVEFLSINISDIVFYSVLVFLMNILFPFSGIVPSIVFSRRKQEKLLDDYGIEFILVFVMFGNALLLGTNLFTIFVDITSEETAFRIAVTIVVLMILGIASPYVQVFKEILSSIKKYRYISHLIILSFIILFVLFVQSNLLGELYAKGRFEESLVLAKNEKFKFIGYEDPFLIFRHRCKSRLKLVKEDDIELVEMDPKKSSCDDQSSDK